MCRLLKTACAILNTCLHALNPNSRCLKTFLSCLEKEKKTILNRHFLLKTKILQDDGGLSFLGGFAPVEEVKVKFYWNGFIGSNCKTVTKTLTPN